MTTHTRQPTRNYRYQFIHGDDADIVAYQRRLGNGAWQTFAEWMVPSTAKRARSRA